jgi:hypothetical protein
MSEVKRVPFVGAVLWFVIGFGIFIILTSFLFLIDGEIGGFFGTAVTGIGFFGLGWAARKIFLSPRDDKKPLDVGKIARTIFSGAGICMIIGSILLLFDEDFEAAIGLFIFGSVFFGVGILAARLFRIPEGKKAVQVSKRFQQFSGRYGEKGERTSQQYVYVDKNIPEADIEKLQKQWAETPWIQRKDWAEGKVVQEGAQNLGILIGFTILWNLISGGITAFAFVSEWDTGDVPWFMLIFPIIGLILIIITFRTWIRRRKFGISIMKLDTLPAYLGDKLRASIETGVSALDDPARKFQVKVLCAERKSSRDSKGKKRVSESEIWSNEQEVYGQYSNSEDTLNVTIYFSVPEDLPPTELIPPDDRILWRINITSKVPGIDYAAQFEIPVFPYQAESQDSL